MPWNYTPTVNNGQNTGTFLDIQQQAAQNCEKRETDKGSPAAA